MEEDLSAKPGERFLACVHVEKSPAVCGTWFYVKKGITVIWNSEVDLEDLGKIYYKIFLCSECVADYENGGSECFCGIDVVSMRCG